MAVMHKVDSDPRVITLDDGTEVYRTTVWSPPGCHNTGCGMRVFVKDGKPIKVEGDPSQPITNGRLCVRCLSLLEYFNHPDRILHPMKRSRDKRGNPEAWEQCTWDEAFDMLTDEYIKIRDEYGPDAWAVFCGTGRAAARYHFVYGNDLWKSRTIVHANSGWSCIIPRMTVMSGILGSSYVEFDNAIGFPDRFKDPKWECPKYILVWGRDCLRSNPDGLFGHSLVDEMKEGAKLIVVDPRANWLATRAEYHLQLRPGTDTALAMAMLNVVIQSDKYDHEFVEAWTYGFDALAERVAPCTPEWAEEITGVPAEDIKAAALCLTEKPSTALLGLPLDQNPNGMQAAQAIWSIFAICGDLDIPGGITLGQTKALRGLNKDDEGTGTKMASEAEEDPQVPGIDWTQYPAMKYIINTTHPDCTLDALETGHPYPIKGAYIFGSNMIACIAPAPKRWYEALRKLDFVAGCDTFMTPTLQGCADLFLPSSTFLQQAGICTNHHGSLPGQFGAYYPILDAEDTKSDLEICIELYHRLYPEDDSFRWSNVENYLTDDLEHILEGTIDDRITYPELCEEVFTQFEIDYEKYKTGKLRPDGKPGFNTPTGRVELYSTVFQFYGDDPLPYYTEPRFSKISRPEWAEYYPCVLATGGRQFTSFHSEHRQIKSLREIHPWPTVQVNPETAAEQGIVSGDWVYLENPWGKVKFVADVTPVVKPNVLHADHAWWLPERDPNNLYDVFESNINVLMPHKEVGPLGLGAPYKSLPCRIYKALD